MPSSFHRLLALSLWLMIWIPLPGQTVDYPLKDWKKKLSVKKDVLQENFMEVYNDISAFDSLHRCIALNKLDEISNTGNVRLRLRAHVLVFSFAYSAGDCYQSNLSQVQTLEDDLRIAYELEDDMLAALINDALSWAYDNNGDPGQAIMYRIIAKELKEKVGLENFRQNSYMYHTLGNSLYGSRDYEGAVKAELVAIYYRGNTPETKEDSHDDYWVMNAWNNLGLA